MVAVEAMILEVERSCPRGLQGACPGTRHGKTGIAPAHGAQLKTALLAQLDYFERLVAWRGEQAHHDQAALGRRDGRGRRLEETTAGAGRYKLAGPCSLDHHIGRKGLPDQQRGGQRHPKDQDGNEQALHAEGNGGQVFRGSRDILGHGRMATGCKISVARSETGTSIRYALSANTKLGSFGRKHSGVQGKMPLSARTGDPPGYFGSGLERCGRVPRSVGRAVT